MFVLPASCMLFLKDFESITMKAGSFIVMLSKSFRKSVQLAEASILILNAKLHLLSVLEASILISNAESHVKDFSHSYYQALLPLSYSITSCLYKEAKGSLTFVYTLSVNSIVKLAYSSCLKASSLLCFPKLSTQSNYLLPCPVKPLQASNCFQTRPRPYTRRLTFVSLATSRDFCQTQESCYTLNN